MDRAAPVDAPQLKPSLPGRLAVLVVLLGAGLAAAVALISGPAVVQPVVREASLDVVNLQPGRTLGQSFVARFDGLSAVEVFLQPREPGAGEVRLRLRAGPDAESDLAAAALPAARVSSPGFVRFSFPVLSHSRGQAYYFQLDYTGEGRLKAGRAPGDAYPDGAMYRDGTPQEAQLTFQLVYSPLWLAGGIAGELLSLAGMLVPGLALYTLPGWALLALAWPEWRELDWCERLGLSAGVSLAFYPLLLLWTSLAGLRPGPLTAWGPLVVAAGVLVYRGVNKRTKEQKNKRTKEQKNKRTGVGEPGSEGMGEWGDSHGRPSSIPQPPAPVAQHLFPIPHPPSPITYVLIGLLVLIFGARLLAIRSIDAPLWGDSVHHVVMAQLMLDNSGLFTSWEPYAPYHSLTVQFGFPALAAVYAWVSGLNGLTATLVAGQIVNGLAVVCLYPLAVRIAGGNRWAGAGALLAAGLLSTMPAGYVNWGRYAQLAGQAILPVALVLTWAALRTPRLAWGLLALAGVTTTGMLLASYRMPHYYAGLLLALAAGWMLPAWRTDWRRWLRGGVRMALVGLVAAGLFAPWALVTSGSQLASVVSAGDRAGTAWEAVVADYRIWADITLYVPPILIIATLAGLGWSLARRQWLVAAMGVWILALAGTSAGRLVGVPGTSATQSFAFIIALYLPVGVVAGWVFAQLAQLAVRFGGNPAHWAVGLVMLLLVAGGAVRQAGIVDPQYIIVTRPDLEAMAWIRAETPARSRFLVEGFRIFSGFTAVGSDAGWWIPLLAGRANTMPPQYAIMNEVPSPPDYTRRVVDLVAMFETTPPDSPEGLRALCAEGISHVYIGQGQGRVGLGGNQLFAPDELARSPAFERIYRQDRVAIYALRPGVCGR